MPDSYNNLDFYIHLQHFASTKRAGSVDNQGIEGNLGTLVQGDSALGIFTGTEDFARK